MPKIGKGQQLVTRLSSSDLQRFRELAQVLGKTHSSLIREAVLFYMQHREQDRLNHIESVYSAQLKACTNRICAMLAKIGIDAHATKQYLAKLDADASHALMQECDNIAVKRLKTALAKEEQVITTSMTAQILHAGS